MRKGQTLRSSARLQRLINREKSVMGRRKKSATTKVLDKAAGSEAEEMQEMQETLTDQPGAASASSSVLQSKTLTERSLAATVATDSVNTEVLSDTVLPGAASASQIADTLCPGPGTPPAAAVAFSSDAGDNPRMPSAWSSLFKIPAPDIRQVAGKSVLNNTAPLSSPEPRGAAGPLRRPPAETRRGSLPEWWGAIAAGARHSAAFTAAGRPSSITSTGSMHEHLSRRAPDQESSVVALGASVTGLSLQATLATNQLPVGVTSSIPALGSIQDTSTLCPTNMQVNMQSAKESMLPDAPIVNDAAIVSQGPILAAIAAMQSNLVSALEKKLEEQLTPLSEEFKNFSNQISATLDSVHCNLQLHEEKISKVESQQVEYKGKLEALELQVERMENHSRINNLKLMGVSEQAEGGALDLCPYVTQLLKESLLEQDLSSQVATDIQRAHRTPRQLDPKRETPRPIIANFRTFALKEKILTAARSRVNIQTPDFKYFILAHEGPMAARRRWELKKLIPQFKAAGADAWLLKSLYLKVKWAGGTESIQLVREAVILLDKIKNVVS